MNLVPSHLVINDKTNVHHDVYAIYMLTATSSTSSPNDRSNLFQWIITTTTSTGHH